MTDLTKAYQIAALAVRQRFAEQHPDYLTVLDALKSEQVAVYKGSFDQAEAVLRNLNIPIKLDPEPHKLETPIVFINCSSEYNEALIDNIAAHVSQGAWLVSSDWALSHVVSKAFPGMVEWTQRQTDTEIISVEPNLNSLWSEIVVLGADPQWWLWGSHPIKVLNPDKVRIEAASHDLLKRYDAPVVAVSFDWGKGQVFHVISHFWAKSSDVPTLRHQGPYMDFLKAGMRLSEEGIEKIISQSQVAPDEVNFAMLQSAATATELVAQLCVRAVQN